MKAKAALWVWLLGAAFYCLWLPAHLDSPDSVLMFEVSRRLIEGHADVTPIPYTDDFGGQWRDGKFYPWFGPGLSVAALPAVWLGSTVGPPGLAKFSNEFQERWSAPIENAQGGAFWCGWINALISAASLALVAWILLELGHSLKAALWVTAAVGVCSPVWLYATSFFSEPLAGLCLLGFVAASLRDRFALAGFALGLGAATRITHLALIPLAVGFLLLRGRARWVALGLGALGPLIGLALYNAARFGSIFETGRGALLPRFGGNPLLGFLGLLVSPGRGLLLFCPLVLVGLWAMRRRDPLHLFSVACLFGLLAIHSPWNEWHGGWCLGPRFLLPVIPLLLLPLAALIDGPALSRFARGWISVAVAVSFCGALLGLFAGNSDFHVWVNQDFSTRRLEFLTQGFKDSLWLALWSPSHSPLLSAWTFPGKSPAMIFSAPSAWIWWLAALGLAGLAVHGLRTVSNSPPTSSPPRS